MGKSEATFSARFLGTGIGLFIFIATCGYFTGSFPNDNDNKRLFRWPFVDYISNPNAKEKEIVRSFNPVMPEVITQINSDLSAKVYRVNTHFNIHIEANDTRVFSDPLLDKFAQLTANFDDKSVFFDVLKANGYKYIFLDLKTYTLDKTPERSLEKKFISLLQTLTSSQKVRLMQTDNYVEDLNAAEIRLPDGNRRQARSGLLGTAVYRGNIALFEIQ